MMDGYQFEKRITLQGSGPRGLFTHVIGQPSRFLEKTAAAGEYHPTIAAYIANAKPIPGKTQILLTALGAGEYWGDNANGDWFGESQLAYEGPEYGFKTFETMAKVFKHHINKPDSPSYGTVVLSVYNQKFHRVELIVVIDNYSAEDIVARVNRGDVTEWSMGCRIPFDVCSVCANRAPKRDFYCYHLKYQMGQIDPETGKKVYAINIRPRFFDISYVLIGADRIAKTLQKVASAGGAREAVKHAEMEKEIPGDNPRSSAIDIEKLKAIAETFVDMKAREKSLPTPLLDDLSQEHSLPEILSTMTLMGILPKPEEFQRLYLNDQGEGDLAEKLSQLQVCFDPESVIKPSREDFQKIGLDSRNFSDTIMQRLSPFVPDRSAAPTHLGQRLLSMVKSASPEVYYPPRYVRVAPPERKPIPMAPLLLGAAGAYAALAHNGPELAAKGLDKVLASPGGAALAAMLGLAVLKIFNSSGGPRVTGQYTPGYENPDRSDVFARIEEMKARPYTKIGSNIGAAGKRIFLGVPAAYMASGVLQKHRQINPAAHEGQVKSFLRQNPDVVGSLLIADGLLAMTGKGTHGMLKKMTHNAQPLMGALKHAAEITGAEEFSKCAGAEDYLSQAITWPLAMGKANLPGRMIGGLFDSAVIDVATRYKKRKDKKEKEKKLPTIS